MSILTLAQDVEAPNAGAPAQAQPARTAYNGGGIRFSDKQRYAATFGDRDFMFNVMVGSIRSGKSLSSLHGFLHWAGYNFNGHDFCWATKSEKQWHQICFNVAKLWAETLGVDVRRVSTDCVEIQSAHGGYNKFWRVISGFGGRQAALAEGKTYAGVYVDDACFHPQQVIQTLADRCSVPGGKMVFTCYPEGPFHPFKLEFVDQIMSGEKDGEIVTFALSDNPSNTAKYLEALKQRWRSMPHEYARRILGQWSASSGLIYPMFHDNTVTVGDIDETDVEASMVQWDVASDWAPSSVTHALLVGTHSDGTRYVWDEWRHDGRKEGHMSSEGQAQRMIDHLTNRGARSVRNWIIDPSAGPLMASLAEQVQGKVIGGLNDRLPGITVTARWMEKSKLKFVKHRTAALLKELGAYCWDEAAMKRGEDKPDKDSADGAHGADALRYYCLTMATASSRRNFSTVL